MPVEQVALDHYRDQQRLAEAAGQVAGEAWSQVDPDNIRGSWGAQSSRVTLAVAGAQQAVASQADDYLGAVLAEQGLATDSVGRVAPSAFAGIASDGRPLSSLVQQPAIATLAAIKSGHTTPRALAMGRSSLDMIVRTQVADAGRTADQVSLVAHPAATGYVRLLVPPSCARCAILAGRWYRYSAGFQRHPRCRPGDCRHIPAPENLARDLTTNPRSYFDSLGEAEQNRIFGEAGARAIRDGADMSQVVNARRGMYTAGGRLRTTVSTTRRGVAPPGRLMPEEIYRLASSRQQALDLLASNGYLRLRPPTVGLLQPPVPARRGAPPRPAAVQGDAVLDVPAARLNIVNLSPGQTSVLLRQERIDLEWRGGPPAGWSTARARGHARTLSDYTAEEGAAAPAAIRAGGAASRRAADRIADVLATSTTNADMVVWRGLDNPRRLFGSLLDRPLVGAEVRDPSFMSVSGSRSVAERYAGADGLLMRVRVPRGTRAVTVDNPDDVEVLLDRGLRLRVVGDSGPGAGRVIDVEIGP